MSAAALGLVVTAAVLHAGWNTFAKRGGDPFLFLWLAIATAVPLLPVVAALAWSGQVSLSAVPYMIATACVHAVYFYSLGRSYHRGDLSTVYPIARGLGIALVPLAAWQLYGETISAIGLAGIATVVVGIVAVGLAGAKSGLRIGPGAGWAVLTGCCTATYSLIDRGGVERTSPVAYIIVLHAGAALLLVPAVWRRRERLVTFARASWMRITVAAILMTAGYTLVLFAFRLSKTGYVVAARELSIVASTLIGAWLLREGRLARRMVGAGLIFAGVVCIALAE